MTNFKPSRRFCLNLAVATVLLPLASAAWTPSHAQTSNPSQTRTIRIVALGDSLSAGYGLPPAAAFPNAMERALKTNGLNVTIENEDFVMQEINNLPMSMIPWLKLLKKTQIRDLMIKFQLRESEREPEQGSEE